MAWDFFRSFRSTALMVKTPRLTNWEIDGMSLTMDLRRKSPSNLARTAASLAFHSERKRVGSPLLAFTKMRPLTTQNPRAKSFRGALEMRGLSVLKDDPAGTCDSLFHFV